MNISEELIEKLVKESIEKKLEAYSFEDMIRSEIRKLTITKIEPEINENIEKIIIEEINKVLSGSIDYDNGWGKRGHYDSFEDMFKQKFYQEMNNSWEIQKIISRTVEDNLNKLFKKKTQEVAQKIQDMVLEEMIKGEE